MFSPFMNLFGSGGGGKKRKLEESSEEEDSSSSEDEQQEEDKEEEAAEVNLDITESKDQDAEVDDEEFLGNMDEPITNFDLSTATLGQLLAKVVPDADIHNPNIIIIGGQSSGKTKMIISMVFHHLIENTTVTDQMGEKLLKLFRTGEKMVTRRPTKIRFMKSEPGSACQITLSFGDEISYFDDPNFDVIVNRIHEESLVRDGKAYQQELKVTIHAPGLPNMHFTDLPGLITDDREVSDIVDADVTTIRKLVKQYMRQPGTTLVVVEPAATEDFDTSQVAPMLRDMRNQDRPHIFNNSVLVLSKCDKIRAGLEGRIMSQINLTSTNIQDYPFRHVVGVVNKKEGNECDEEIPATFAEFKQQFRATKLYEREVFSAYHNTDGTPCDPTTQCTTAAVFNQMDRISFAVVHKSIENGLRSILEKVELAKTEIKEKCAPPLAYYDRPTTASGRRDLLEEMRATLKRLVANKFKLLNLYERHSHDSLQIAASQEEFLRANKIKWPDNFAFGDMFVSQKQFDSLDAIRKVMNKFVYKKAVPEVKSIISDEVSGCFSPTHSRFHRIDRFPDLVCALHDAMVDILPECARAACETVSTYLQHFWDFEVPRGEVNRDRLFALLDQLKHVALRKMFEQIRTLSKSVQIDELIKNDALMTEDAHFAEQRHILRARWENLHHQEVILEMCDCVNDNESLRKALEAAFLNEQNVQQASQEEWLQFWEDARQEPKPTRVVPPSTAMFHNSRSLSQSHTQSHSQSQTQFYSQQEDSAIFSASDPTVEDVEQGPRYDIVQQQQQQQMDTDQQEEIYHPSPSVRSHSSRSEVTPFKRMKASHETVAEASSNFSSSSSSSSSSSASGALEAAFESAGAGPWSSYQTIQSRIPTYMQSPSNQIPAAIRSPGGAIGTFATSASNFLNRLASGSSSLHSSNHQNEDHHLAQAQSAQQEVHTNNHENPPVRVKDESANHSSREEDMRSSREEKGSPANPVDLT